MTYSLSQLAWFFLIYSILGWCISVAFCAVKKHSFVNPGFLNLPVSPIYGIGAVLSTVFLSELTHHPLFFILGSCVLSGILVITTGVAPAGDGGFAGNNDKEATLTNVYYYDETLGDSVHVINRLTVILN